MKNQIKFIQMNKKLISLNKKRKIKTRKLLKKIEIKIKRSFFKLIKKNKNKRIT